MSMQWTTDQQKVISLRDRNILVSAAAGSGKTAVLVQRILERIMDKENPIDVDELLIMTFTRAAAGEMKERISAALENAVGENPDNEHLLKQMTALHTAQITTIDGFCGYVIRNYFHMIDLDPGYRVGDEGEMKLLCQDVLNDVLEECYAEKNPEFENFVECYTPGKSDEEIKEYILQVYNTAMSNPFPEEWLEHCLDQHMIPPNASLSNMKWMKFFWINVDSILSEAEELMCRAKRLCLVEGGPIYYEEAINCDLVDIQTLRDLSREHNYDQIQAFLAGHSHKKFSGKKVPDLNESIKAEVSSIREDYKKMIKGLKEDYFGDLEQGIFEDILTSKKQLEVLVSLTRRFINAFSDKKREKNLIDFTDMEHFALQILLEKKGDEWIRTNAALELSARFKEVMVDEYQDSNLVQEYLTAAVSGNCRDIHNTFMVGDVKQSIYRFRQARPDLFMKKYDEYQLSDSLNQRIDLHKNFRSRSEVLSGVNYIFRQIMGKDLGGIQYDQAAALHAGADFPAGQREEFAHTEVMLIEKDSEELSEEMNLQNQIEIEALAIAQRIQELVQTEKVYDKESGLYRSVEYGDIVVLLRTADKWAEKFSQVFVSHGIPTYTASRSGYFSALEVVTVLNYLKICDNPYQDIPLFGVLRSPIVGLSSEEVGIIRMGKDKMCLYECLCSFDEESQLRNKIDRFLSLLRVMRKRAAHTPVHQLIIQILEETGYGNFVKAMPAGEQRNANIGMLVEKAMDYEKTSYRGLFNFVRYIEQLRKFEVDFGEVNLAASENGAVQIMTIHKSKGLEFPIVFASGMGKNFNLMDTMSKVLVHPAMGLASDAIYPDRRLGVATLIKKMVRKQLIADALGEELRVLYVALTRAKEKLIITGTAGNIENIIGNLVKFRQREQELLPLQRRLAARSYWSYLLPALSGHRCMDHAFMKYGIYSDTNPCLYDDESEFVFHIVTASDLIVEETENLVERGSLYKKLKEWEPSRISDVQIRTQLEERFGFLYPYEMHRMIPSKASISELKKSAFEDPEVYDNPYVSYDSEFHELIPEFISGKTEEVKGAARGTAYHKVMECLDYCQIDTDEMLKTQIQEMVAVNKMSQEEADAIIISDIRRFLDAPIGQRMKKAALAGMLMREQPFVFSVPASRLNQNWEAEASVIIQGIIDAYFIEDHQIVILDYKTDKVYSEEKLCELYHKQLEGYGEALERITGLKVKQKLIYSFTLHREITP